MKSAQVWALIRKTGHQHTAAPLLKTCSSAALPGSDNNSDSGLSAVDPRAAWATVETEIVTPILI
jgi:hypothetical protein